MLRAAGASAAVLAGVVFAGATPAQAAYPTSSFSVPYGNAGTSGTLTWYNRSIGISGSVKSTLGNCRQAMVYAYLTDGTFLGQTTYDHWICVYSGGSGSVSFSDTINTDVRGAANYVYVCIRGGSTTDDLWSDLSCKKINHP
jgi:hypothetical protein